MSQLLPSPSAKVVTRQDTSICPHLVALLASSSTSHPAVTSTEGSKCRSLSDHVEGIAEEDGTMRFRVERRFVEVVIWGAQNEGVKRRRTTPPKCHSCSQVVARPWACLSCNYIGCIPLSSSSSSTISRNCMMTHWSASDKKCGFAVDPFSGAIYCNECNDATYPDRFEYLLQLSRIRVEETNDHSRDGGFTTISKGKKRGHWKEWQGTTVVADVAKTSCRGLRPLLNLSQTCFLSAILQALIHNPLLKAYFLSDKHNRHVCPNGSRGLAVGKPYIGPDANGSAIGVLGEGKETGCMCCEMDRAFEEFYSEDKTPFGPITMLYSMWHASAELEGHGQQDAHSFFLAALDQIHAHAKGQLSRCSCIAHSTFSGSLLSAVTCSKCHTTSSTVDPILDVQLDFPITAIPSATANGNGASQPQPSNSSQSSTSSTSNGNSGGTATSNGAGVEPLTLAGMLRRFCAEEKVGDIGKGYDCAKCGGGPGVGASRRLMIKKLPPVLSFQLKRFAHSATSTKVETGVRFPSKLDMRPYTDGGENESKPLPPSNYLYDLFAVVTHEGKLDNGHYWADVLTTSTPGGGGDWWHCDDDKITPTSLKQVLGQRAYMLFYVKRSLGYEEVIPPSTAGLGVMTGVTPGGISKS